MFVIFYSKIFPLDWEEWNLMSYLQTTQQRNYDFAQKKLQKNYLQLTEIELNVLAETLITSLSLNILDHHNLLLEERDKISFLLNHPNISPITRTNLLVALDSLSPEWERVCLSDDNFFLKYRV